MCIRDRFMNIKCRASGLAPDCVVLVATVRALKSHSGHFDVKPGHPLDERLTREDLPSLAEGLPNLEAHIESLKNYGVPVVVVVNSFPTDTPAEHALIRERAAAAGADFAVSHDMHASGGMGGVELAEAVVEACELPRDFRLLYDDEESIEAKIEAIATRIYGADGVTYSTEAEESIATFKRLGYSRMPICVAKTQFSLSHDASFKGRPTGWKLPVRDVRASVGAGFLYPLAADIRTMPGLPTTPAGNRIGLDEAGGIVGLS
jgi:formyltetrahydrofolate synthetase